MNEDVSFNEHVEKFKKLSVEKKKQVTISEMKQLLVLITLLKEKFNVPQNILYNKEILDANGDNVSEEDFVEAIFVYINIIKEAFSEYVNYTINNKEDL